MVWNGKQESIVYSLMFEVETGLEVHTIVWRLSGRQIDLISNLLRAGDKDGGETDNIWIVLFERTIGMDLA